jgi:VIT1/CCC1 family predicted Fe2+/Mn2+ transporter
MLAFAVVSLLVILVVALVGVVCAQFDAEDLRKMGIRH